MLCLDNVYQISYKSIQPWKHGRMTNDKTYLQTTACNVERSILVFPKLFGFKVKKIGNFFTKF